MVFQTVFHHISWYFMVFHHIPWYFMVFHCHVIFFPHIFDPSIPMARGASGGDGPARPTALGGCAGGSGIFLGDATKKSCSSWEVVYPVYPIFIPLKWVEMC